jgi:hypothetical protein
VICLSKKNICLLIQIGNAAMPFTYTADDDGAKSVTIKRCPEAAV